MSEALKHLWHQVEEKNYAKSPPKGVLHNILTEIRTAEHYMGYRSWELLVELLAQWTVRNLDLTLASMNCMPFHGLDLKKHKKLYDHINDLNLFKHYYTAAKSQPWDYIGELYAELGLVQLGQNMTPKGVVDMMIQMTFTKEKNKECKFTKAKCKPKSDQVCWLCAHSPNPFPITQLDPCTGTGRFLFESSILNPELPLVLMGIEINLALYRACLVNMAMFSSHVYSIVCADALRLDEKKSGPTSKLWDLGNRWDPPDITEFYWKPTPFLTGYIKAQKTA